MSWIAGSAGVLVLFVVASLTARSLCAPRKRPAPWRRLFPAILLAAMVLGALNFFAFMIATMIAGGSAVKGSAEYGHYVLRMQTRRTDVGVVTYWLMYAYEYASISAFVAGGASVLALLWMKARGMLYQQL